ncbi:hypothetical protein Golomagni_05915, partial [Golovinomyces magnicellulatus]
MSSNPTYTTASGSMPPPPPPKDINKKVDINSLMSPPDPIIDSFNQTNKNAVTANGQIVSGKHPLPMSPPVSPYSKPIQPVSGGTPVTPPSQVKDPVLYPTDESSPSAQPSLFVPVDLDLHQRIVDNHVRARSASGTFGKLQPPQRQDYLDALNFQSQVLKQFSVNPRAWLRKEREFLVADRKAGAHRYHSIMPAKSVPAPKPSSRTQRTDRVSKPQGHNRAARTSISSMSGVAPTKNRAAQRTSATPEPSRRASTIREDKDFMSIPDYSPPLDSLPNRSSSLMKPDWRGQPIDLSGDEHVHLLHPDELMLAANLRLDCATYLTSKRRLFERRVECLRIGKAFRKTDAQQACNIDVNKASKLWTAFDK